VVETVKFALNVDSNGTWDYLLLAYYFYNFCHFGHFLVTFFYLLDIVIKNIAEAFPPTLRDQDGVAEIPLDLRD